jgi:hypothetical protein
LRGSGGLNDKIFSRHRTALPNYPEMTSIPGTFARPIHRIGQANSKCEEMDRVAVVATKFAWFPPRKKNCAAGMIFRPR